jgi:hypothetical protein
MSKILVTGGCSFSQPGMHTRTWPQHLSWAMPKHTHVPTGLGSQGNGLISRRVIHQVYELLKSHSNENICVGIMWSGPNRQDFYFQDTPLILKEDNASENPTKFIQNSTGSWTILNHHWNMPLSKSYYQLFHDMVGQYIYSYEHILRTQWFLKLHNIKYFMTTYTGEVFQEIDHADTKHLYDQIDFDHFLPVVGEYEWCRDYSGLEFPVKNDNHPSTEQHRLFTKQVIIPFLQQRNFI